MRLPINIPLIIENVKITGPDGTVRVDLILDTGAILTAISSSVLNVIGYNTETITANGIIELPKLKVDKIAIGNVEAKDIEVMCHDIPELAEIQGLLGLSFLQYFRTVIDYKQGYLEIS
jgi:clan AA aspartic protease (TIGR02281 family)